MIAYDVSVLHPEQVKVQVILVLSAATLMLAILGYAWRRDAERQEVVRRLFEFTENSADWLWEIDNELRVTYLSDRYAAVTGVDPQHTIGKTVSEISKAAEDQEWLRLGTLMATRKPFRDFTYRFTHRDGGVRHFLLTGKPFFDWRGVFMGYRGAGSDVTSLYEVQERLFLQQTQFHTIFEQAPNPIGITTLEGRFYLANAALAKMLGYTLEELLALSTSDVTYAEDREATRAFLTQVLKDGSGSIEKRYVAKDGRIIHGIAYVGVFKDSSGQPKGLIGQIVDVTPLRAAREKLLRSEAEFRAIFEQAPNPIGLATPEGRFIKFNAAYAKFLGYSVDEFSHLSSADVTHPEDFDDTRQCAQRALQEGGAALEKRYITKNGGVVIALLHMAKAESQQGEPMLVCQVVDLTEIRRVETELRQAKLEAESHNRAKSAFLANMSHELRTPLNAVIGFSEVIETEMFGPLGSPKYIEYASDIRRSGVHLLDLINDILDLARVEAGKMAIEPASFLLAEEIHSSVRAVELRAKARELRLELALDAALATIYADRRAFRQILLNLLTNAVKFSLPGGTVTVSAKTIGDTFELKVIDTGIGISAEDLARIGRPFEQVASAWSRSHEGAGLGLSLCRSLVMLHRGEFRIESQQGKGTTVTVTLPQARSAMPFKNAAQVDLDAAIPAAATRQ